MPDVSLNGIEFTIKGSSDAASDSVKKLTQELTELRNALGKSAGISGFANQIKKLENIDTAMLSVTGTILKDISKIDFSNLQQAASDIKDIASAAKAVAGIEDATPKAEPIQKATHSLKEFFTAQRMTNENSGKLAYGLDSMRVGFLGLISGAGKAAGGILKVGLAGANAARRLVGFPPVKAINGIKGFGDRLKGVLGSFKRVMFYRVVRTIIKEIGQAFAEGIKNLYGWSKLMGGAVSASGQTFAQSMDSIATSLLYFKNSIGAAVSPLIGALAPAIDFVIDKIVTLINLINQLLAKLSGASSWNRAVKKATEYGDAVGGAGSAAKEALRYLAPFDELNRLPDNKKGGGGGGSAEDYSGMFEEVAEFNECIANFADAIKDAVNRGDWQGLGTLLGEKVNEIIDRINFAEIGTKVGEKINALFTTEYWTLKTINFQNIGKKVAEFLTGEDGIGGALRQIDFSNIGGIMAEKMTALPEVLIGVVNNLDFSVVGQSLGDTIRGFLDGVTDFIQSVDWGTTLENAIKGMFDFIKGMDIMSLAESLLTLLGSVVGAVGDGLVTLLGDLADVIINPDTWKVVWAWMQDIPAKLKQLGIDAINAFTSQFTDGLNNFIENHPKLASALGLDEPIEFQLIPDIPKEELNKHYNQAKADIEAASKADPTNISAKAQLDNWKSQRIALASESASDPVVLDSKANLTAYKNSLTSKTNGNPVIASYANLTAYKNSLTSKTNGNPVIASKADLTAYKNSLTSKTNGNPVIGSYANLTAYKNALTGNKFPSVGSNASFTSTSNDLGYTPSLGANASMSNPTWADGKTPTMTVYAAMSYQNNPGAVMGGYAKGGAFYGGLWHSIPQYAKGTARAGSMFIAGEAGPEVVGHIGGRTEVLNQSQLAATMYAAVRSALSGLQMAVSAPSVSASVDNNATSEETMYRAFSRALADSDLGGDIELDGDVLYSAMVNRNRRNTRLTGVNAMA